MKLSLADEYNIYINKTLSAKSLFFIEKKRYDAKGNATENKLI